MSYGQVIRVRVPRELADWVRARADQQGATISEVVREAIDRYLENLDDQDADETSDDDDDLHVRLSARTRSTLAVHGSVERLVKAAIRRYRRDNPPLTPRPSAAVGPSPHDIFLRLPFAIRQRLERQASRHRVSVAAIARFALNQAARRRP